MSIVGNMNIADDKKHLAAEYGLDGRYDEIVEPLYKTVIAMAPWECLLGGSGLDCRAYDGSGFEDPWLASDQQLLDLQAHIQWSSPNLCKCETWGKNDAKSPFHFMTHHEPAACSLCLGLRNDGSSCYTTAVDSRHSKTTNGHINPHYADDEKLSALVQRKAMSMFMSGLDD